MATKELCLLSTLGRDPEPFELILDDQIDQVLYCRRVIRAVLGKRLVCLAHWQGREVYAKLYFGPRSGRRYWYREVAGLQALHERDIVAPTIVHIGTALHGGAYVILLELIHPAEHVKQAWERAAHEGKQIELLRRLVAVIARQHAVGLEQRDLHLNNFLLAENKIYTLDGGDIKISRRALSVERSLNNLAWLFAQLHPQYDRLVAAVFPDYAARRGWSAQPRLERHLYRRLIQHRRRRRNEYLGKTFRDCSAFACHRNFRRYMVCRRSYTSPTLEALLANPDASLEHPESRLLKLGNTCTVWLVPIGTRQLIIKRYNIKNFWHGLSRSWRRTRAAISWKNAHRLEFYGILTASPVALIEERFGPLRQRAYFITEAVEGENCPTFFSETRAGSTRERTAVRRIAKLLERLRQLSISHGDLKGTNLILGQDKVTVIDLDGLHEHRWSLLFRYRHRQDIRRFLSNWQDNPRLSDLFRKALEVPASSNVVVRD